MDDVSPGFTVERVVASSADAGAETSPRQSIEGRQLHPPADSAAAANGRSKSTKALRRGGSWRGTEANPFA